MAANAPTTGAPTSAPGFSDVLHAFEAIQGECSVLRSLIESASNEVSRDGLSHAGMNMVEAAGMVAELIMRNFGDAVAAGYITLNTSAKA